MKLSIQVIGKKPTVYKKINIEIIQELLFNEFYPQDRQERFLSLTFLSKNEIRKLNFSYRKKNATTNVLAFPLPITKEGYLGDIAVCLEEVEKESKEQEKDFEKHLVHIIIHGILHLVGLDHKKKEEKKEMESIEVRILNELGIADPYHLDLL